MEMRRDGIMRKQNRDIVPADSNIFSRCNSEAAGGSSANPKESGRWSFDLASDGECVAVYSPEANPLIGKGPGVGMPICSSFFMASAIEAIEAPTTAWRRSADCSIFIIVLATDLSPRENVSMKGLGELRYLTGPNKT